jgi:hypothetical protein
MKNFTTQLVNKQTIFCVFGSRRDDGMYKPKAVTLSIQTSEKCVAVLLLEAWHMKIGEVVLSLKTFCLYFAHSATRWLTIALWLKKTRPCNLRVEKQSGSPNLYF